jgi:hypothetical protein
MLAFLAIFSGRFPGVFDSNSNQFFFRSVGMGFSVDSGIRAENAAETIVTAGNKQFY